MYMYQKYQIHVYIAINIWKSFNIDRIILMNETLLLNKIINDVKSDL